MTVIVYNLSGHEVWTAELADVSEIIWDGTDASGIELANGGNVYVITAADAGTRIFEGTGTVFVNR